LNYFGARYFSGAERGFTSPDEFKGGGVFDPSGIDYFGGRYLSSDRAG
jgi:hypothetical protein